MTQFGNTQEKPLTVTARWLPKSETPSRDYGRPFIFVFMNLKMTSANPLTVVNGS